jgi:hypothetical protein
MKRPIKRYVVKTYVDATSASAAIRKSRHLMPDEVTLDGGDERTFAVGFEVPVSGELDDDYEDRS